MHHKSVPAIGRIVTNHSSSTVAATRRTPASVLSTSELRRIVADMLG
jgi:hypothetical protein